MLGVRPRTVRALRSEKSLPHLKIGGKILRFRRADIEDWILKFRVAFPPRTRRVGPATPPPRQKCHTAAPGNESGVQNA